MRRVPTRTLVLMVLTLLAFGWMYWQTHRSPPPAPAPARDVQIIRLPATPDGNWAAMDEALRAAVRQAYGDAGPAAHHDDAGSAAADAGPPADPGSAPADAGAAPAAGTRAPERGTIGDGTHGGTGDTAGKAGGHTP